LDVVIQKPKQRNGKLMKTFGRLSSPIFAALAIALLIQTPAARADENDKKDDRNTVRLIPSFNPPVSTYGGVVAPPLPVGTQLTFGGTVAQPAQPGVPIGTVGVHFVVTLSDLTGDQILGHGCMTLPDGKISYQILLRRPVVPDSNGNINRYSAITGGTGVYRNAGGELNHQTRADGSQEFILNFSK
jgi:hypothetical protein